MAKRSSLVVPTLMLNESILSETGEKEKDLRNGMNELIRKGSRMTKSFLKLWCSDFFLLFQAKFIDEENAILK